MYNGISSCFDQGGDTVPQKDIHRQMPKTSIPHVGNLRGDNFVLLYMVVLYLNKNSGNATLTAPPSASQTYAQSSRVGILIKRDLMFMKVMKGRVKHIR